MDSGELHFESGFNLIVGPNNVGKSALLQCLSANFGSVPHISLKTKPRETSVPNPTSVADVVFEMTGEELRDALMAHPGQIWVGFPKDWAKTNENYSRTIDELLAAKSIDFRIRYNAGRHVEFPKIPSFSLWECNLDNVIGVIYNILQDGATIQLAGAAAGYSPGNEIGHLAHNYYRQWTYIFNAERMLTGECAVGSATLLDPNARNLPEVLHNLQPNKVRYEQFNRYINEVFPTIQWVSVVSKKDSPTTLQILVWTEDPNEQRLDLALPLQECGTGVSQVLAILYVAFQSPLSRVIVIDEPNSFLHPGAARKLMRLLRDFSAQQFIVSTHSPDLIKVAEPAVLHLLSWEKPQSAVETLNANGVEEMHSILRAVGASLTDVYPADSLIWVEGVTEQDCFPLILEKLANQKLLGTSFIAVEDTGSFESQRPPAKSVWRIYRKLTQGNSLLPKAIAFSFDREGRTDKQMQELNKESSGLAYFLPRRMFENYLLSPRAIAAVLSEALSEDGKSIEEKEVEDWIMAKESNPRYVKPQKAGATIGEAEWLSNVKGAVLLYDLFSDLSDARVTYNKRVHGLALTHYIIEHEPQLLSEVRDYLVELVKSSKASVHSLKGPG